MDQAADQASQDAQLSLTPSKPQEVAILSKPVQLPSTLSPEPEMQVPQSSETHPVKASSSLLRKVKAVVKSGDTLSGLFNRNGIDANTLFKVLEVGPVSNHLKRLFPGDEFHFTFEADRFLRLEYPIDDENTLLIERAGEGFTAQTITRLLDVQVKSAQGVIESSLFLSAQKAGLSDAMTMEIASIFGWDVDFALEVREGDSFAVIYQELYRDGKKVRDGKILAAEFVNRGHVYRTAYYKVPGGRGEYFTADGKTLRKSFIRTPVDFARVSSGFSLSRKHPILHTIRAHKGVDYAAAKGTPIKASGDGKIVFAGRKGGYGNTLIIKHGEKYTTLYAHLSRFAKNIRSGVRVRQSQIIGYVGSTGLASGPHLHYEFRVNGVHRNPLTVRFPGAAPLPQAHLANFKTKTAGLFTQLSAISSTTQVAEN
ncbi:MAG TPA: peptidase M23 [Gammaproteobacteria bacterium]|nr:peptidase M23 [Gammaproteobacteria bacterium]